MNESVNAPTFRRRNNLRVILITLLIIGLIILLIYFLILRTPPPSIVEARVDKTTIKVGESIYYIDSSKFAKERLWSFGDGTFSSFRNGYHPYKAPGDYTIELRINKSDSPAISFSVSVVAVGPVVGPEQIKIHAPETEFPEYNIEFVATGTGNGPCKWIFGDDGVEYNASSYNGSSTTHHAYNEPGPYDVSVRSSDNRYGEHRIIIKARIDTNKIKIIREKEGNDFLKHLQMISNEIGSFNDHYYYLLRRYLCSNEKAIMRVGDKSYNFDHYCNDLLFDNPRQLQSATLTYGEHDCVISADITEAKQP